MRNLFSHIFLSLMPALLFSQATLDESKQLLVVISEDLDSVAATLQRFERGSIDGKWSTVGSCIPVVVGKNGMGWGCDLLDEEITFNEPIKIEGDNKAPAGIFELGQAFGFNQKESITPLKWPYLLLHSKIEAIDDLDSMFYNQIIDTKTISFQDWNSSEKMGLESLYKWGLVIEYNTHEPKLGYGSCIFMHIWKSPKKGTAGCTAMSEDNLIELLYWLEPSAKPKIVQLPHQAYIKLTDEWHLPDYAHDCLPKM